ncbi:helix-turn-helix transcriptional regulator [uncultured Polaribacter sp.]|uniref:helix-turn-helix domain-containing protein n=1 Tax=uncultured Polaribacter sp. TaxID=174711 RepID=UPI0026326BE3|nr:helix-turn-helix transcriptional regulator [uncultured Polaribacter sp.]
MPRGYNINPVTIGDYLKQYRLQNGYTTFELSLELDVYQTTIYKWENNESNPKGKNLNKLIEFMGYDPRIHKPINTKYYELN